jgi:hypothetical protein
LAKLTAIETGSAAKAAPRKSQNAINHRTAIPFGRSGTICAAILAFCLRFLGCANQYCASVLSPSQPRKIRATDVRVIEAAKHCTVANQSARTGVEAI